MISCNRLSSQVGLQGHLPGCCPSRHKVCVPAPLQLQGWFALFSISRPPAISANARQKRLLQLLRIKPASKSATLHLQASPAIAYCCMELLFLFLFLLLASSPVPLQYYLSSWLVHPTVANPCKNRLLQSSLLWPALLLSLRLQVILVASRSQSAACSHRRCYLNCCSPLSAAKSKGVLMPAACHCVLLPAVLTLRGQLLSMAWYFEILVCGLTL